MQLKSLYFDLDRSAYPNDYGYDLLLRSRKYCHYIEQMVLKPLKFQTENFNRIVLKFQDSPEQGFEVNPFQVLCMQLPFDKMKYEKAKKGQASAFFMEELLSAFEELERLKIKLPIREIREANVNFIAGTYLNQWVFKKKTWRDFKLEVILECELTDTAFELTLKILKNKELKYDKIILSTDPDPVAYDSKFKDMEIVKDLLIVKDKFGDPLVKINWEKL